jgi:outer membrane protein OmpA-like peptidoglycan-associated protein
MTRIRALTAVLLVAWLGLACASTPDPVLCGQIGLALGMGGGVAAGAESSKGAGPVIGYGALGAVVGGAGGYLLCKALEKDEPPPAPAKAEPKPAPPPPPAEPKSDPCAQVIRLRGVNFDFDKAVIREDASVVLDEAAILLGESLAQCRSHRVIVEGHTDASGPEAYNLALSEQRAEAVRSYLAGRGVDAARLEARGEGEAKPIADNASREGRALNRRVELRMTQ